MMKTKLIRTEEEYQDALDRIEELMDAIPGSPEEEELDLLSFLADHYEQEQFPIDLPDPIEAIKFRMEQQGLTRKDLIPFIGSQSRVSEVLNRKRPLSLSMIRALHEGLGIPAEVLLREPGGQLDAKRFDPADFPLKEMVQMGYFPGEKSVREVKEKAEELLMGLMAPLESSQQEMTYCRATQPRTSETSSQVEDHSIRDKADSEAEYQAGNERVVNEQALRAWQARVLRLCAEQKISRYKKGIVTVDFLHRLTGLSVFPNGPLLARQVLLDSGIHFVVLPRLPKTYLDGACFLSPEGVPVVALTLRYDRVDNFWFTLIHELSHLYLHLDHNQLAFFDDTTGGQGEAANPYEVEANQLTRDVLISHEKWEDAKRDLLENASEESVIAFAHQLQISPAIVAGRVRWETENYTILNDLLGSGMLRKMLQ